VSAVTIALDAMGGDRAPSEICAGARDAAIPGQLEIVLVGDAPTVRAEYGGDLPPGITLRHAPEQIAFNEDPAGAVRSKPESSIVVAASAVREGWAHAAVSAGSTGALLAASTFSMRRIPGVLRPGLAAVIPAVAGPLTLIDCGANVDPRPEMLVQFAHMGACFAEDVLGRKDPRVGLMSIGEEPGKGNQLTKEAYELLASESGIDFAGNVEGRDIVSNKVQVIVTDGFTGNVCLKTAEGTANEIFTLVKAAAKRNPLTMAGGLLLRGGVRDLRTRLDPETYGGAFLLGLAGISVAAHGSSSRRAIANACRMAAAGVRHDVCGHVAARVGREAARAAAAVPDG
jgi:glycerol-3-phosphate acyltransferase PlsX